MTVTNPARPDFFPTEQEDRPVIRVTRLNGEQFALNPDLIERVEAHPDTVVFLVDGTHVTVAESMEQVLLRIRDARAGDIVACYELDRGESADPHALQDMLAEIAETRGCPVAGQTY